MKNVINNKLSRWVMGALLTASPSLFAFEIVLEAETMEIKTTGTVTRDGWNLWANGSLQSRVDFAAGKYEIKVRARGVSDQGAPRMRVHVGGKLVIDKLVESSLYEYHTAVVDLPAGRQVFSISYVNDAYTRKLYLEKSILKQVTGTAEPTPIAAPAPAPAPTPTPEPAPIMTGRLRFAPPVLSNPITVQLGTGFTQTTMDPTRDYIIKLPASKKTGGTALIGGRNVVIMGGHITIPLSANGQGGGAQRAIYIKDNKGTVHIEGVLIDGSGGGESDAIAIAAPDSIVQVQNVRVDGIIGKNSTWHADLIQPWGGVRELRVYNFTGSSGYQGFQLAAVYNDNGPIHLERVNASSIGAQTRDTGGQLIWVIGSADCSKSYNITLKDFYVKGRPEKGLEGSVWPQVGSGSCNARMNAERTQAYWPMLPSIKGVVNGGVPAGGDFVPQGVAGVNYKSPGYN